LPRNSNIMRKIYLLFSAITVTAIARSQTVKLVPGEDTTKAKELSEVVITGQYLPQSARNSVYQVRSISKERIQQQAATKLQDVLSNELNIRFSQDLATGGSGITMMGLRGQNVKILVDGLPMTGRQGTSNEVDINQIDINSIEKIEIVEGPMSVVYGADALAGVINIITKKANRSKFAVTARLQEESIGDEYGIDKGIHNQHAGLTFRHKKWELGGAIGRNYFGGWKDTATGRELVWHKKDQIVGNGFVGYLDGKLNLRYRFDGLDEIITNPGNYSALPDPNSGNYYAYDQEYLSQRLIQQLQGSYSVSSRLNLQLQTAYNHYSRQVFSTTVNKESGDVRLDPAPGKQSEVDFNGFTARGTVYYKLSSVFSFQPGIDVNLDRGKGERLKAGNNAVDDYAFFLTSEITPTSKINIRPGIRIIKNSVYDAPPVVPSINTKIALTDHLDLRLSYARGFRAPSLRELYFDFVDANHNVFGNPDLKAETSHSFNGSLTLKKITPQQVVYSTVLTGFYNNVRNMIDYQFSSTNPNEARLMNLYQSKTAGVSLATITKYKNWNLSLGGSYTGFYNDLSADDESLPELQWSAEVNSQVGYTFSKAGLSFNLFYKFTGERPYYVTDNATQEIIPTTLEGYHMADLTAVKKLGKYFAISAGVRNLFDVDRIASSHSSAGGVHSDSGTRNIASGRAFFAGLQFNWEKN
jgi:outer membrane receptor for ferrienterochelin and colicins